GIAMGNVIGSNIANIGLILGLTALICPIVVTGMKEVASNGLVMTGASVLFLLLSMNGKLSRIEGILLFLLILAYTIISIRNGRRNGSPVSDKMDASMRPLAAFLLLILSCAMLSYGADLLVKGASSLASTLGVSDKVIGLTVVAFGTSLPELAASVAAALKKQMDISIGNIVGSNIFNILCVLGVSCSITPITFQFSTYLRDLIIMLAFAVVLVLMVQPWKQTGKLSRLSGLILFLGYAAYAWSLF
ncbi:MAG: sodium:calcium antiporter, partial [Bacteroidaceae bacterium]|nr:sodium:calcium antiporter [Bacteroidaceae bacterium]